MKTNSLPWNCGRSLLVTMLGLANATHAAPQISPANAAIVRSEFIYETASFPSCHASTIEDTGSGLVAAWFGGTAEKHPDVGIWVSRHDGRNWSAPVEVANGVQPDGKRHPTWNPVLFQSPGGPLLLFYKVGPSPDTWWGMLRTSADHGKTWSEPLRLRAGVLGPIKNKPVLLRNGTLLCPSSSEHEGWRVHLELTRDQGRTWKLTPPLNDGKDFGAIQPTVLFHSGKPRHTLSRPRAQAAFTRRARPEPRLQLLCRGTKQRLLECWSEDGGKTWGTMQPTEIPNPNSGADGITLRDGRHLLVYNPVTRGRTPLVIGLSRDGRNWQAVAVLEDQPGEYSYPAIIQDRGGKVHVTYTWKRQRIRHVVLDPARLEPPANLDGK